MPRSRRIQFLLGTALLLTSALPVAARSGEPSTPPPPTADALDRATDEREAAASGAVTRLAGDDRIGTAVAVSASAFPGGTDVAYVATAGAFPDALTGGPSAARDGAPILLTRRDALPVETRDELVRLGPDRVVLLGGEGAVSGAVADELADLLGAPPQRLAGANRYETAVRISQVRHPDDVDHVYLSVGTNFPDALTGGAAAARDGAVILLATSTGLPQVTSDELARLDPLRVTLLGGTGALPDAVGDQVVERLPDVRVDRLAGTDRFGTAAAIAGTFHAGRPEVFVATGATFPDAMAGTPAANALGAPLLLVGADRIPDATVAALERARPRGITVLGGPGAVSTAVEARLADFLVEPAVHHIGVRDGADGRELFDRRTDQPFRPRGWNHLDKVPDATEQHPFAVATDLFRPATSDMDAIAAELDRMAELGYDAIRVFIDLCQTDCISARDDGVDGVRPAYVANIARYLELADERGMVVMLASNDVPDPDYSDLIPCCDEGFTGYRNGLWLTAGGHEIAVEYWTDVVSALIEADAPLEAVFAYEVQQEMHVFVNEAPFTNGSGSVVAADGRAYDVTDDADMRAMIVNNVRLLTDRLRDEIRELDPSALVTLGYFSPGPGDVRVAPQAELLHETTLDFLDLHPYPGGPTLTEHMDAFGWTPEVTVPIVLGEFGAFAGAYASPESGGWATAHWQAESCDFGFQGWFGWLWKAEDDEVFGARADDDEIGRILAPTVRPDPCSAAGVPRNLSLEATATAEASLPDHGPDLAVDGNWETTWESGGDAPAWIELDLGGVREVVDIGMIVAQFPAGDTTHVLRLAGADHVFSTVHVFDGPTDERSRLTWRPDTPVDARYVRVETTASPSHVSWYEIQVSGS